MMSAITGFSKLSGTADQQHHSSYIRDPIRKNKGGAEGKTRINTNKRTIDALAGVLAICHENPWPIQMYQPPEYSVPLLSFSRSCLLYYTIGRVGRANKQLGIQLAQGREPLIWGPKGSFWVLAGCAYAESHASKSASITHHLE